MISKDKEKEYIKRAESNDLREDGYKCQDGTVYFDRPGEYPIRATEISEGKIYIEEVPFHGF